MSGTEQPASQEQAQKVNGVKENSHVQKKLTLMINNQLKLQKTPV